MSVHVTFDSLAVGDSVTNQFENDLGLTFTAPVGTVVADPLSPYGSAIAGEFDGGPVEFPDFRLKGTFSSKNHSRISILVNKVCYMNVFNASGTQIGSVVSFPLTNSMTDGTYRSIEFATGAANIASFDVVAVGRPGFNLAEVVFDNTAVSHRPDFRLMFSNAVMPPNPGATGFFEVTVARLYGPTGGLALNVSTDPSDAITHVPELGPFDTPDGGKIRIPLTGGSRIGDAQSITVAGTAAASPGPLVHSLITRWIFGLVAPE